MSDLLQSEGWERFQRALGRRVERVDGVLAIRTVLPFGLSYWYSPRGSCRESGIMNKESWDGVREVAREDGAVFWRGEFDASVPMIHDSCSMIPRVLKHSLEPEWTWRMPLAAPNDERLATMHEKHRYNVRLAQRRDVRVVQYASSQVTSSAFEPFWQLLQDTAKRQGISTHPRSYYETMLASLAQGTSDKGQVTRDTDCLLYIAERDGIPLAAAIVAYHGDTATYIHGGSSYAHRALMAPHLLHWQAMREAKAAGMRWYEWGGVQVPSDEYQVTSTDWAGITRFKKGFGGEAVHHPPTRDLAFRPGWYRMLSWLARIRGR